jgi:hypothetical protein
VRVDNASNPGLPWERTRAEWRIVRMVDGELGWGPKPGAGAESLGR